MTRLAIIFSLLFVTPAVSTNKICPFYFDGVSVVADADKEMKKNKCEAILLQVDRTVSWGLIVADLCDFNSEIVVDNEPLRDVIVAFAPTKN